MWFDSGLHVLEGYSLKTISDYVWKMAQGAKLIIKALVCWACVCECFD